MRASVLACAAGAAALLAACGGASEESAAQQSVPSSPVTTALSTPPVTTRSATSATPATSPTSTRTRTRTATPSPTPRTTKRATKRATVTRTSPAAPTCAVPRGVGAAQVVLVTSSGSRATIRACTRTGGRYLTSLGPYSGHVGKNGVSSAKREGDLRTPAGVFPLRGGFGARSNPGLRVGSWLRVGARDVWVDDPSSKLYNTHQRTPADGRWSSAEPLLNTPAYDYAQVIGYNEARAPGRGSAIFLHVDLGHGTAGCVSLPTSGLLAVLRWERTGAVIAIR
ncbi:MAG: L,D-transpeptidase family protein [Angustibacter sp.]